MTSAIARAEAWIAQDPDPVTRGELQGLIAAERSGDVAAAAELEARFASRLEFGTAGLRGEIGAGPLRMNRLLVTQAAAGLAAYLLEREERPSVVIGYDGRHYSRVFAEDSAEILAGAGVATTLLPRMLPTPVLAFAVRTLDTSAGVMVTASHNPARDNGYKVYLGGADGGSQIVSPADAAIAAQIERVAAGSIVDLPRSADYTIAGDELVEAYIGRSAEVVTHRGQLSVVYTPMHGVGREVFERVIAAAGFAPVTVVTAQAEPDPDFPTVAFPNPEEAGAMDLAIATAIEQNADLILANDPDADRVAVAIRDTETGGFRQLSGNEVGWLLGWEAARRAVATGAGGTLACSMVSSPALAEVARRNGLAHVETLTGFKWISRVPRLAFGYEEALGYLVDPAKVRDKDGISAAMAVLSLASELAERGAGLGDRLLEFAEEFGGFASQQISLRVADLADIGRMMAGLRQAPPAAIGGVRVAMIDDFLTGVDGFEPADILRFRLADGARVIVRPSGTEPKLKCYVDTVSSVGEAIERVAAARAEAATIADAMRGLLTG